jgi:hypothetical protein
MAPTYVAATLCQISAFSSVTDTPVAPSLGLRITPAHTGQAAHHPLQKNDQLIIESEAKGSDKKREKSQIASGSVERMIRQPHNPTATSKSLWHYSKKRNIG